MPSQIISKQCAYMKTGDGSLFIKDFENNELYALEVYSSELDDRYAYIVDEEFVGTLYQVTPTLYLEGCGLSATHPDGVYRIIRPMLFGDDEIGRPNQEAIMAWAEEFWCIERSWQVHISDHEAEDVLMRHSVQCKMLDRGIKDEDN